jgi:hypothetical protein
VRTTLRVPPWISATASRADAPFQQIRSTYALARVLPQSSSSITPLRGINQDAGRTSRRWDCDHSKCVFPRPPPGRPKCAKSGRCRTVWRMGHVRPFAANPRPYAKRAPGPTGPGRSFERVSSTRRATLVQSNRAPPINVLRSLPIAAGRRFRCLKEGRRRAVSPSNALRKRRRRDATAIGRLLEGERFPAVSPRALASARHQTDLIDDA